MALSHRRHRTCSTKSPLCRMIQAAAVSRDSAGRKSHTHECELRTSFCSHRWSRLSEALEGSDRAGSLLNGTQPDGYMGSAGASVAPEESAGQLRRDRQWHGQGGLLEGWP